MKHKARSAYSFFTLLAVSAALLGAPSSVSADATRQYKIEAAFLYNFFNYITWPGNATPEDLSNATICVYGGDPVEPYLAYVKSKMAKERVLNIRKLDEGEMATGCHILFTRQRPPDYVFDFPSAGDVLTVFEPDDPLDRGGMIELSRNNEQLMIRINQSLLVKKGFQVSSRLLNLAQKVE